MYESPPPGFRGLDFHKPINFYRRRLPHWRQDGATYFITFRLVDSLPASKLKQLQWDRDLWMQEKLDPAKGEWDEMIREEMAKVEKWLDQGHGACVLSNPKNRAIVADTFQHFHDRRYVLNCSVIMANHIHLVVRPNAGNDLETIIQSWKRHSSNLINRRLNRHGTLWQEEYFDRIVRNTRHLRKIVRYIERNPNPGSDLNEFFWIMPEWVEWLDHPMPDFEDIADFREIL